MATRRRTREAADDPAHMWDSGQAGSAAVLGGVPKASDPAAELAESRVQAHGGGTPRPSRMRAGRIRRRLLPRGLRIEEGRRITAPGNAGAGEAEPGGGLEGPESRTRRRRYPARVLGVVPGGPARSARPRTPGRTSRETSPRTFTEAEPPRMARRPWSVSPHRLVDRLRAPWAGAAAAGLPLPGPVQEPRPPGRTRRRAPPPPRRVAQPPSDGASCRGVRRPAAPPAASSGRPPADPGPSR